MAKNVIIVGVPRSGTSMTAAIFARKGYYFGGMKDKSTREGNDNNPFGYFEADDLIAGNVEVLQQAGFEFHNTWMFQMISERSVALIAQLVPSQEHRRLVESYEARSPWVWKDPRLCFTIPYWWKLMDQSTTAVLLVRRDEAQIYHSWQRVGYCEGEKAARARAFRCIRWHVRAAERGMELLRIPHLIVDYADFLNQPAAIGRRLGEFCGLELSPDELNARPDLNHSTLRGRISTVLRRSKDEGILRHFRMLRDLCPDYLLTALFPERKYQRQAGQPASRVSDPGSTPSRRSDQGQEAD